jgi:hypothetical protein
MAWARIDPGLHDHPKFLALTRHPRAVQLWVFGLSWATLHSTSGFIRAEIPQLVLRCRPRASQLAAKMLVRVGLWDERPGGYQIHDYLDYNFSKEQEESTRAASRERQRRFRAKRPKAEESNGVSHTLRNGTRSIVSIDHISPPVTGNGLHGSEPTQNPTQIDGSYPQAPAGGKPDPFDDPEAHALGLAHIRNLKALLEDPRRDRHPDPATIAEILAGRNNGDADA